MFRLTRSFFAVYSLLLCLSPLAMGHGINPTSAVSNASGHEGILRDTSADLSGTTGTSYTAAYKVGRGNNRLLVVEVTGDFNTIDGGGGHDDITGVTYAGTAMTLAAKNIQNASGSPLYTYLYFLLSPATGSNNVVISSTNSHGLYAIAADYTGVKQSGQPDATATNQAAAVATTLTSSITTVAQNDWVILAEAGFGGYPTAGAGGTLVVVNNANGDPAIFDSAGQVNPGSNSLTTNRLSNGEGLTHILAAFAPAP